MNKPISIYLDLIRFLAAVTVFFVHANYDRFTGGLPVVWRLKDLGNDAVMVFFVLSGFVIAYVSDEKEKTLKDYFVSRFARLYSVAIPALILTVVLDNIGLRVFYDIYDGGWFQNDRPAWRLASNVLFVNELWFTSVRPFSNGPFWSLGYEFWYYVIFAVACYLKTPLKYLLLVALCLFIGPKILILFPVWLLGVLVYHIIKNKQVPEFAGWVMALGSLLLYTIFRIDGYPDYLYGVTAEYIDQDFMMYTLKWSQEFLSSYAIGILVAVHLVGVAAIAPRLNWLLYAGEKPIRYLAGFTFATYLFHYPLLQFFAAIGSHFDDQSIRNSIMVFGSMSVIWALGTVTERRKADIKRWILFWCDLFSRKARVRS
ncbi:MAG: acyltransferase [Burkholderiaceae bacterium]|nr:acyltransferase [Burkholderiaceae bacterium]